MADNLIGVNIQRALMDIGTLKDDAGNARQRSLSAEQVAEAARKLSEMTQEELSQAILAAGDSSEERAAEVGSARVDALGTAHNKLKVRLDLDYLYTTGKIDGMQTINVLDSLFQVVHDGSDTTEQLHDVFQYAVENNLRVIVPNNTFSVENLTFPSGLQIHFQAGSMLKLIDDPAADSKVITCSSKNEIKVTGMLNIDGNFQNVFNQTEHMHGLFIYNSHDIFIENLYAHNCYGDNLSVTGGSNAKGDYSTNIRIGNMRGFKAGRKNLVIEHVDQLNIEVVSLDNTTGGYDERGGNCIDCEPFAMREDGEFLTNRLGQVKTVGTGNDFSAGTAVATAEKFVLNIDSIDIEVLDLPTTDTLNSHAEKCAFFCYGITINCRYAKIRLATTNEDTPEAAETLPAHFFRVQHATRLNFGKVEVYGGVSGETIARMDSGDEDNYPIVNIEDITLNTPNCSGFYNNRSALFIEKASVRGLGGTLLSTDLINFNTIRIVDLEVINSCETSLFRFASGVPVTGASILFDHIKIIDDREEKLQYIMSIDNSEIANVVRVGKCTTDIDIEMVNFQGSLWYDSDFAISTINDQKQGGLVQIYTNPEGIITANQGTIAINKRGADGSTLFVKETGNGNTGWTALLPQRSPEWTMLQTENGWFEITESNRDNRPHYYIHQGVCYVRALLQPGGAGEVGDVLFYMPSGASPIITTYAICSTNSGGSSPDFARVLFSAASQGAVEIQSASVDVNSISRLSINFSYRVN